MRDIFDAGPECELVGTDIAAESIDLPDPCLLYTSDEENGFVRLAALRFLCKLGATTAMRSEKVWPLLDEDRKSVV